MTADNAPYVDFLMSRGTMRFAPRDEWPDLRFTVRPFPWTWRVLPRLYRDDVDGWRGHWQLHWFFLTIEWWANVPMFQASPVPLDSPRDGR